MLLTVCCGEADKHKDCSAAIHAEACASVRSERNMFSLLSSYFFLGNLIVSYTFALLNSMDMPKGAFLQNYLVIYSYNHKYVYYAIFLHSYCSGVTVRYIYSVKHYRE